jgi:hypothetical protein
MRQGSFWEGLMVGVAACALMGLMVMERRKSQTPMERTKRVVARTARRALKSAQGTISSVAGRLSD